MLILTKEEVSERISCFEKLIGIYNKKIEFLHKILVYFEKSGKNIDCVVLNVCVQEVPEDTFNIDDQIHILKDRADVINDQENHLSFATYPVTTGNTTNSKSLASTLLLPKYMISSETVFKNTNGSHIRPVTAKSTSKLSTSLSSPVVFEESRKSVVIVPKLEPFQTANQDSETMDTSMIQIPNNEVFTHFPNEIPVFASNNGRTDANVFLMENDVATNTLSSVSLSIKKPVHLNGENFEIMKNGKVKQFQCEICSSAFAQKGVLNRHKILRHSPFVNKPHVCPNCRKAFTLKHHLKNHLKCKSGCRSNSNEVYS